MSPDLLKIKPLVESTERLSEQIHAMNDHLAQMTRTLAESMTAMNASIAAMAEAVQGSMGAVHESMGQMSGTMRDALAHTATSMDRVSDTIAESMDKTTSSMDGVGADVRGISGSVRGMTTRLTEALTGALADFTELQAKMTNPRELIKETLGLDKALSFDKGLKQLQEILPDFIKRRKHGSTPPTGTADDARQSENAADD